MSSPSIVWSDWQPLVLPEPLSPAVLTEVVDGGQTFRWNHSSDGVWQGVWADCVARLKPAVPDGLLWSAPPELAGMSRRIALLFRAGLRFDRLVDDLPWRSDPHLARCLKAFPGLRLLRQPLEETLLCFLCSSTKQIVQIKQMVELLAQRHGREIAPGIHRLPRGRNSRRSAKKRSAPACSAFARVTSTRPHKSWPRTGTGSTVWKQLPYHEARNGSRAARCG